MIPDHTFIRGNYLIISRIFHYKLEISIVRINLYINQPFQVMLLVAVNLQELIIGYGMGLSAFTVSQVCIIQTSVKPCQYSTQL